MNVKMASMRNTYLKICMKIYYIKKVSINKRNTKMNYVVKY